MNLLKISFRKSSSLVTYGLFFTIYCLLLLSAFNYATYFIGIQLYLLFAFGYIFALRRNRNNDILKFIHKQSEKVFSYYFIVYGIEILFSLLICTISIYKLGTQVPLNTKTSLLLIFFVVFFNSFLSNYLEIYNYTDLSGYFQKLIYTVSAVAIVLSANYLILILIALLSLFIAINTINFPNKILTNINYKLGYGNFLSIQKVFKIDVSIIVMAFAVLLFILVYAQTKTISAMTTSSIINLIVLKISMFLNIVYFNSKNQKHNKFIFQLSSFPNVKILQIKTIVLVIAVEFIIVCLSSLYFNLIHITECLLLIIAGNGVPLIISLLVRNWIGTINNEKTPTAYFIATGYLAILLSVGVFNNSSASYLYSILLLYYLWGIAIILFITYYKHKEIKLTKQNI